MIGDVRPAHLKTPEGQHLWRLAAYSAPSIPLAIMIVPVSALIPIYYSGTFGLSLQTIGFVLLLARVFDVVTDPLVGMLSDRTRSPYGRRRPWMVSGVPILLIGVWLLFVPPLEVSGIYLLVASTVTYLGWTLIQIPYWSWGAEIAQGYDDRSTLSGFRESAMIGGIAVASLAPIIANVFGHDIDRTTMTALAIIILMLLPATIFLAMRSFREELPDSNAVSHWSDVVSVLVNNVHFRRLAIAFAVIELGKGASVAVAAYLMTYYFDMPELIGLVLLLPYILIIVSVPFWLAVSKRIGKSRTVALSLFCAAMILALGVPPLSAENGYTFLALECGVGLAAGGFAILPTALVADTADYYADKTGGAPLVATHFAAWSLTRKLMQALSIGAALPLLAFSGFDPVNNPGNNAEITKWMFIVFSVPFYLVGVWLMMGFGLTKEKHDSIRSSLKKREQADPLKCGVNDAN